MFKVQNAVIDYGEFVTHQYTVLEIQFRFLKYNPQTFPATFHSNPTDESVKV